MPTQRGGSEARGRQQQPHLTLHCVALVLNEEQGDGGAVEDWQVVLAELHEGPVGSPLQSVVEVIAPSHGEPSRHSQVRGVSQDVHMDPAASTPELTVWVGTVRWSTRVAKVVQHVSKQSGKAGTVQPVATEPSVGIEGGVGVVIHLLKKREKRINI
jgi:hypothetical protein